MVAAALRTTHGWGEDAIEIVPIRTSGDRIQDRALADVGGKALWTKELDRALIDGEIDFAVHSMKDVETIRPAEIVIAAMLPRADVRDRLIGVADLAGLPANAVVGTSSPRRSAQVRRARPDVSVTLFRGNVDTRLAKLAAALGLAATVAPLFTMRGVAWQAPAPENFDALMLTSANALRFGGARLADYHALPVFAVGEATAAAARAAGFADVHAGDRDAVVLLNLIAAAGHAHVLHLAGREHRAALHPALTIERAIVYDADPAEALTEAACAALADGAVVLLHSPHDARVFGGLAGDRARTRIAVISDAAAEAAGPGWAAVAVAERPDDAAILAAAARLCDQAG